MLVWKAKTYLKHGNLLGKLGILTHEFLGLLESFSNPGFKPIEFDRVRQESGYNSFTPSPQKWIKATNAIGIISKSGRYGGTFAHKDIAFENEVSKRTSALFSC